MEEFVVREIDNLLLIDIDHLVKESMSNGFRFLERLVIDYKDGTNTFHHTGESLFGVFSQSGLLIAIGGINIDPFSENRTIGRLRRFYVANAFRRIGVATLLLDELVVKAKNYYQVLVLHTDTIQADMFYTNFGFLKDDTYVNSTHYLKL